MENIITKIETPDAPLAIGPYSQGIIALHIKGLIFVSGQLPIDPDSGLLLKGDIKLLTRRVLLNIEAILKAGRSSFEHVVRVEIFLKDLEKDFKGMNEEYTEYFGSNPPARQTIQVAGLPKDSSIEISCIALCD